MKTILTLTVAALMFATPMSAVAGGFNFPDERCKVKGGPVVCVGHMESVTIEELLNGATTFESFVYFNKAYLPADVTPRTRIEPRTAYIISVGS